MMRNAFLLVLFAATFTSRAQSFEQWLAWGDAAFERGEFYGASRFYGGALEIDGGRMSVQWKQAEACRLSHQYDKAAALYDRVQRKDMGRTHPEALRWLGEMQLSMGDYVSAEGTWRKVLQKEKDKKSFTAQRAENALIGCALAKDTAPHDPTVLIEHLPQPVNTYDSEFGARIGPDSALYFASLRGELDADGVVKDTAAYHVALHRVGRSLPWAEPIALGSTVNGEGDNANITWSTDHQWILFTRCLPGVPCRIHIAPVDASGNIGEAHLLPGIGEDVLSTQPMVVHWADREILLFVSDRPGGHGGTDIWQGELHDGEVKFIFVHDLGVNTPGNERSPWYDTVTNSLWFSSDFLPGLGGYDIFSAAYGDDIFAAPVNAGAPINSPANDLYPVYDPMRGEGWLTSNRKGSFAAKGETCCNDLYRFIFESPLVSEAPSRQEIDGTVVIRTQTPSERLLSMQDRFPLKLYFHNDDPDPRSWDTRTEQTYGETYARYDALESEYETENADPLPIRNFFVEQVAHGFSELRELATALWPVLEQGRAVILEVRGHASPLARNDYNRNLSMRRIESLRNHLRAVDDGRLAPYMNGAATNGGKLTIRELPFGEDRSAAGVSDELSDLKRSVYSVEASRERRIEIEAIGLEQRESDTTGVRITKDVGALHQNEPRQVRFSVLNAGKNDLRLVKMEAECGCTTAELPEAAIAPGASTEVVVSFNGRAPMGPITRKVKIETDGVPKQFILVLQGDVIP